MLTAVLFMTAKTWKQPKSSQTKDWIKEMWYIHTMQSYSAIKMNETMPFAATRMDLVGVILSEVSQTKRNTV